jgi:transcriptional regulator with XRE-family HTH domain
MTDGIARRIKQARLAYGLSQGDLANAMGNTTREAISQWESGKYEPKPERIARLAEILHVTAAFLITGKGQPPTTRKTEKNGPRFVSRLTRLVNTGGFDDLIEERMIQIIHEGKFDEQLKRLGYTKRD